VDGRVWSGRKGKVASLSPGVSAYAGAILRRFMLVMSVAYGLVEEIVGNGWDCVGSASRIES